MHYIINITLKGKLKDKCCEVIFLKKRICVAVGILAIGIFSYSHSIHSSNVPKINANSLYKPSVESQETLNQDIFISLLHPYTQKAINQYYEKYLKETPFEDPWFVKVLSAEMLVNGPKQITSIFLIKLEVAPYLGPHNSVGVDHITFKVQAGEVTLEKFEHIKSFPIAPNYQQVIKKWPPS
jgi:hypothetical protein